MFAREELIRDAEALEPLPASSARLSTLLAREDWSLEEVARTATLDQALTGRLLRWANSAASGAREPISSVSSAVMRMGPDMVLTIALGQGLEKPMKTALPAYGMAEDALWRHSVASAMAVEVMRKAGLNPPGGSFVAALVHDVGKLVIGRKLAKMGIKLKPGNPDDSWVRDEAEQMGIDHAELSGSIARHWELPGEIPEAVDHHHCAHLLEPGTAQTMARFVAAADAVAHSLEHEEAFWNPLIQTHLGLKPDQQEKLRSATRAMVAHVLELYA